MMGPRCQAEDRRGPRLLSLENARRARKRREQEPPLAWDRSHTPSPKTSAATVLMDLTFMMTWVTF
jgi:hypothetical protein